MILLINNSINNIKDTTWNLKAYYVLQTLIGSNAVLVNNNDEMNFIIETNKDQIKGVVLTGSNLRIGTKLFLDKVMDNILPIIELNVPILALCFGMQILGSVYQSKFGSFTETLKGKVSVNIDTRSSIFKNLKSSEIMYVEHNDWLLTEPILFKIIAVSENNIIYGIEHKEKPIYGLQFHPECNNSESGIQIYKNFLDICSIKYDHNKNYNDVPKL